MVTKECKMKDFSKLDASPAAMLVQLASRFESSIYVDQGARRTNAKSIMGVMILNFTTGTDAIITGCHQKLQEPYHRRLCDGSLRYRAEQCHRSAQGGCQERHPQRYHREQLRSS